MAYPFSVSFGFVFLFFLMALSVAVSAVEACVCWDTLSLVLLECLPFWFVLAFTFAVMAVWLLDPVEALDFARARMAALVRFSMSRIMRILLALGLPAQKSPEDAQGSHAPPRTSGGASR